MTNALNVMAEDALRNLRRQEEEVIQEQLQWRFGYAVKVVIRRPRWMPEWMYLRLMRTIVVEEHRA